MKSPIAALALFGMLAVVPACAQTEPQAPPPGSPQPSSPFGGAVGAPGAGGSRLVKDGAGLPELTPVSDLKPPTVDLPNEPVEPYLLTKENGPFMVMAQVFRGADAQAMALALVKELRGEFGLPAYILRTKDFPGKSLMRGTPPTVPSEVMAPDIKMPEKIRTFDEAAVLVGNEKTLAAQEKLWRDVKKTQAKVPRERVLSILVADGFELGAAHDQSLYSGAAPVPTGERPARGSDEFWPQEHRQLPRQIQSPGCRILRSVVVPVQPHHVPVAIAAQPAR